MSLADEVQSYNLTDEERQTLRKRWGMNSDEEKESLEYLVEKAVQDAVKTPRITFWFPKHTGMASLDRVIGPIPRVGDRLYLENFNRRDLLPEYNWVKGSADLKKWYVKSVSMRLTVHGSKRDQLLNDHEVAYVEVRVDYNRWGHWLWELSLKYYHWPKMRIRDYFRYRRWRKPSASVKEAQVTGSVSGGE